MNKPLLKIKVTLMILSFAFISYGQINPVSDPSGTVVLPSDPGSDNISFFYTIQQSNAQNLDYTFQCTGCISFTPNTTQNIANLGSGNWGTGTVVEIPLTVFANVGANISVALEVQEKKQNGDPVGALQTENFAYSVALPIDLVSFRSRLFNSSIQLDWQTATELNNEKFQIQRSQDGYSFETIAEMNGAGNSFEQQSYSYIDTKPLEGVNYYRLKQIDFDGQYEYSSIEIVRFGEGGDLATVYPTATNGLVTIDLAKETSVSVAVMNYQGRILQTLQRDFAEQVTLDLSNLPQGNYIIQVQSETQTTNARVVKF